MAGGSPLTWQVQQVNPLTWQEQPLSQDNLCRMPYQPELCVSQPVLCGVLIRELWGPKVATSTVQPSTMVMTCLPTSSQDLGLAEHILAETGAPKDSNGQVLLCKWL